MNVTSQNPGEAIESFLSGKHSQVDIRKIEAELSKLWTQAAGGTGSNEENTEYPQVIRSCSSNLILYTDREDAETTDANMLDDILLGHPSRAILAICREAENKKLEAWVSARCHLAPGTGSKQICSEQITVVAEGNMENELVSVVESLLLGDLPTYLWWTVGDLTGDKLGLFLGNISRLIVDSATAPYSFKFLRDLHQVVESTDEHMAVSDLNWRRLFGIRAAIAEELEREPFSIADLKQIKKVLISSCGQEFQEDHCSIQSLLFIGWLASRLGWEAVSFGKDKSSGKILARFNNDGKTIDVEFTSTVLTHVKPGSVYEVEIEYEGARCLRVCRDPSGESASLVVMVKENGERTRELLAEDNDIDRVHLVGFELEDLASDRVYPASLEAAYKLIHLLEE